MDADDARFDGQRIRRIVRITSYDFSVFLQPDQPSEDDS